MAICAPGSVFFSTSAAELGRLLLCHWVSHFEVMMFASLPPEVSLAVAVEGPARYSWVCV
jgi:hypothetical protein